MFSDDESSSEPKIRNENAILIYRIHKYLTVEDTRKLGLYCDMCESRLNTILSDECEVCNEKCCKDCMNFCNGGDCECKSQMCKSCAKYKECKECSSPCESYLCVDENGYCCQCRPLKCDSCHAIHPSYHDWDITTYQRLCADCNRIRETTCESCSKISTNIHEISIRSPRGIYYRSLCSDCRDKCRECEIGRKFKFGLCGECYDDQKCQRCPNLTETRGKFKGWELCVGCILETERCRLCQGRMAERYIGYIPGTGNCQGCLERYQ